MSGVLISDPEHVRAVCRDHIDSRRWWVILLLDDTSTWASASIEEQFYHGHGEDFELMMIPWPGGLAGVAFAHKRRMSVDGLRLWMRENATSVPDMDGNQDIICCTDRPQVFVAFGVWFQVFLYGSADLSGWRKFAEQSDQEAPRGSD